PHGGPGRQHGRAADPGRHLRHDRRTDLPRPPATPGGDPRAVRARPAPRERRYGRGIMRRLHELEARRLNLIARCEQQRLAIAYRLAQLSPAAQLAHLTRRAPTSAASHPLAWLASLATLIFMMRERRIVGLIGKVSAGM